MLKWLRLLFRRRPQAPVAKPAPTPAPAPEPQDAPAPSAFERSMKFVAKWEGGFSDHPNDPGGRTNFGVTQRVYDAYRRRQLQPTRDVRFIAKHEVDRIYRVGYWDTAGCDELAWPLCLAVFDVAVNSGPARAVKMLQQACGATQDGRFGPLTQAAAQSMDAVECAERVLDIRTAFYRRLVQLRPKSYVFLRGWLRRVDDLRQEVERCST